MSRGPRAGAWALHRFQRGRSWHSFPVERLSWVLGCDVLTQHFDDTKWGCLLADFPPWMWRAQVWHWCSGMDYLGSVAELLNLAVSLPIMWARQRQLLSRLLWNTCRNWEFTQKPAAKKSSSSYFTDLGTGKSLTQRLQTNSVLSAAFYDW